MTPQGHPRTVSTVWRAAVVILLLAALAWCLRPHRYQQLQRWDGSEWHWVADVPSIWTAPLVTPSGRIWLVPNSVAFGEDVPICRLDGGRMSCVDGRRRPFVGALAGEELWFAAGEDVNRFDGTRRQQYRGLLPSHASSIVSAGRSVWVLERSGVIPHFDGNEWRTEYLEGETRPWHPYQGALATLPDGSVWCVGDRLWRYAEGAWRLVADVPQGRFAGISARGFWIARKDDLVLVTRDGRIGERRVVPLPKNALYSIREFRGGLLALSFDRWAFYDGHRWREVPHPEPGVHVHSDAALMRDGSVLAQVNGGALYLQASGFERMVMAPLLMIALMLWMRRVRIDAGWMKKVTVTVCGTLLAAVASLLWRRFFMIWGWECQFTFSGMILPAFFTWSAILRMPLRLRPYVHTAALFCLVSYGLIPNAWGPGGMASVGFCVFGGFMVSMGLFYMMQARYDGLLKIGDYEALLNGRLIYLAVGTTRQDVWCAQLLLWAGRLTEAEARCRKDLEKRREYETLNLLGRILLEQERYGEAADAFQASRELKVRNNEAPALLAEVYLRQGVETEQALALTGEALSNSSRRSARAEMESLHGWALAAAGRVEEAQAEFRRAFTTAADDSAAVRALLHYRAGRALPAEAADQFERAAKIDPNGLYGALAYAQRTHA